MKEVEGRRKRPGVSKNQELTNQKHNPIKEARKPLSSLPNRQPEQLHGDDVNTLELRAPIGRPLPFEPNLSNHEQRTANLDPEVEKLIRAYAESEAEGDPKKEKRLFTRYLKDSSFIKTMTDFKLHGPVSLTYGSHLDFSELRIKQKKAE